MRFVKIGSMTINPAHVRLVFDNCGEGVTTTVYVHGGETPYYLAPDEAKALHAQIGAIHAESRV